MLASALLFNNRQIILARAATLALPAIYQWPTLPAEGALIGYGPRLERIYGDIISRQLVKLLRGTKPADIPVEQSIKFGSSKQSDDVCFSHLADIREYSSDIRFRGVKRTSCRPPGMSASDPKRTSTEHD